MTSLFGGKSTQEVSKDASRAIKSDQRGIDREVTRLTREEHKCEAAIKAAAKKPGVEANARILAKQLVQIRAQKARLTNASAKVGSVASSVRMAGTNATVMGSMASAAKVMGKVNKEMDTSKVAETMQQFEVQSEMMNQKEEMIDNAMECLDEDNWEEEDETLAMVMDELGLEVAGQMSSAPKSALASSRTNASSSTPEGEALALPSAP